MPGLLDMIANMGSAQPQAPQQQQGPLTFRDMLDYISRNPSLAQQFSPLQNSQEQGPPMADSMGLQRAISENAATRSPQIALALQLQRMLGIDLSPPQRINEGFGMARQNPSLGTAFDRR